MTAPSKPEDVINTAADKYANAAQLLTQARTRLDSASKEMQSARNALNVIEREAQDAWKELEAANAKLYQ